MGSVVIEGVEVSTAHFIGGERVGSPTTFENRSPNYWSLRIGEIARGFNATAREVSKYIDGINEAREELKQGEVEIREREERIRSLLEVSPIGFTLAKVTGELLLTNDTLRKILGKPLGSAMSLDMEDVYRDPQDRKR